MQNYTNSMSNQKLFNKLSYVMSSKGLSQHNHQGTYYEIP
jgi:hypothetical protein